MKLWSLESSSNVCLCLLCCISHSKLHQNLECCGAHTSWLPLHEVSLCSFTPSSSRSAWRECVYSYRCWKIITAFLLCFLSASLADQRQLLWPVWESAHLQKELFSYLHSLGHQVNAQICAYQRSDCGAKILMPKSSYRINIWGLSICSKKFNKQKSQSSSDYSIFFNICPGKAILKVTQTLLSKHKVIGRFTTHVINDVFAIWEGIIAYRNTVILSYNW